MFKNLFENILMFIIFPFLFIYMAKSGLYFGILYQIFYLVILIKACNFKILSAILSSMNSFKQKKMSNAFQQKTCVPLLQA